MKLWMKFERLSFEIRVESHYLLMGLHPQRSRFQFRSPPTKSTGVTFDKPLTERFATRFAFENCVESRYWLRYSNPKLSRFQFRSPPIKSTGVTFDNNSHWIIFGRGGTTDVIRLTRDDLLFFFFGFTDVLIRKIQFRRLSREEFDGVHNISCTPCTSFPRPSNLPHLPPERKTTTTKPSNSSYDISPRTRLSAMRGNRTRHDSGLTCRTSEWETKKEKNGRDDHDRKR